jgi:hypothetical protein
MTAWGGGSASPVRACHLRRRQGRPVPRVDGEDQGEDVSQFLLVEVGGGLRVDVVRYTAVSRLVDAPRRMLSWF